MHDDIPWPSRTQNENALGIVYGFLDPNNPAQLSRMVFPYPASITDQGNQGFAIGARVTLITLP